MFTLKDSVLVMEDTDEAESSHWRRATGLSKPNWEIFSTLMHGKTAPLCCLPEPLGAWGDRRAYKRSYRRA
jgi:hypothetical protein